MSELHVQTKFMHEETGLDLWFHIILWRKRLLGRAVRGVNQICRSALFLLYKIWNHDLKENQLICHIFIVKTISSKIPSKHQHNPNPLLSIFKIRNPHTLSRQNLPICKPPPPWNHCICKIWFLWILMQLSMILSLNPRDFILLSNAF